jgi:colanic acid/amylovoran biosynthesis glycosyltransferase
VNAERRPRLLVVAGRFPVVSETFVVDHVLGMAGHGWDVTVAYTWPGAGPIDDALGRVTAVASIIGVGAEAEPRSRPSRVARLMRDRRVAALRSSPLRQAIYYAHPLRRLIERIGPDVVHAHFGHNAMAAALAVGGPARPVVADFHGHDVTRLPAAVGWRDYRRVLRKHHLIAHSSYVAGLVEAGTGRRPTLVRYEAASAFTPVARADHWPRPLRILFVGRLEPEKGPDTAISVLGRLVARRPDLDARLTVVGGGRAEADARSQADRSGLGDRVSFVGPQPHSVVATAMADHDILLVPSRETDDGWTEGFGLVAAEALGRSMAVVASRTGGLIEAVGRDGVLVPPAAAHAMVDQIEVLIDETTPREVADRIVADRPPSTVDTIAASYDALARSLLTGS